LEFLTENTPVLIIVWVAPGFISLKIWSLVHPSQKIRISESIIEAIIFSGFTYIATIWLFFLIRDISFIWVYFLAVLIVSVLCPILLKNILGSKFLKQKTISLIPKSWDYFFWKKKCCFMLVHVEKGRVIGGLYGPDSFASSYPEKEDIYLQEVWKIDEKGKFLERIPGSKGLLVNSDVIEYIEFFDIQGENNE